MPFSSDALDEIVGPVDGLYAEKKFPTGATWSNHGISKGTVHFKQILIN